MVAWALAVKLLLVECNRTLLMISQKGSGKDLMTSDNKPLPETVMTQICVATWLH